MIETVRTFSALSEEFVELYMKHHPVAATEAGIHDYDHVLPDDSPSGLQARAAWLRDLEQRLVASVPWQELPVEPRVDYALLLSRLAAMRADLDDIRVHASTPSLFLSRAYRGVHLLLSRPFAPIEERKEAVLDRLMALPDYFAAVQANVARVSAPALEVALDMAGEGPGFVDDVVRTLLRAFPGEAERLEHAASRGRAGFLAFHDFLDRDVRRREPAPVGIGERWMNFKLEREHLLGWTCADLEAIGRDEVERSRKMLEEEARRLDPRRDWRQLLAEGRERRPEYNALRDAYVAEMERAKQFVLDRKLAPLPAGEKLEIVDTPVFERGITPYAAYQPPAPFDHDTTGFFYVTPIDLRRSKDQQAQQLSVHCTPGLPLAALHEGYPGHHLQASHAVLAPTRLRRLSHCDVFAEGWAFYCEDLMDAEGFFTTDPFTRLFRLRDQLWRAWRVVLDVGLQTGRIGVAEAQRTLTDEVLLPPVAAEAEVHRYVLTPTQPLSFLVGKLLLVELRDEARKRLGSRFDLSAFHAALLASGTIPPTLIREEIWSRLGVKA